MDEEHRLRSNDSIKEGIHFLLLLVIQMFSNACIPAATSQNLLLRSNAPGCSIGAFKIVNKMHRQCPLMRYKPRKIRGAACRTSAQLMPLAEAPYIRHFFVTPTGPPSNLSVLIPTRKVSLMCKA